jgi:hypothetical protein
LDDEAKIDAASRTGDNVPERRRQMAADPRSTTRETREVPELEISFEQVLAVGSQDVSGRRSTLELVRDIARVQGELTAELFERLQNHAVYAALNDHDRSLIDAALHDNLKGPLKRLMFYMLKASCNKKARERMTNSVGWKGMVARTSQMLGMVPAHQRGKGHKKR